MLPSSIALPTLAELPAAAAQLRAAIAEAGCPVVAFEGEMGPAKPRSSGRCAPSWR